MVSDCGTNYMRSELILDNNRNIVDSNLQISMPPQSDV